MKYPMINKQPRREVNVPELSGGLNLRDSLTGVRDNQMTECVNMWFKDGKLRTRPPFVTNENMCITSSRVHSDFYVSDIKSHINVKNGDALLVSSIECDGSFEDGNWLAYIGFYWQYPDKTVSAERLEFNGIQEINCKSNKEIDDAIKKSSRLIFEKDGYIYLFLNANGDFSVYKSQIADKLDWNYISRNEYYIPTVYAHCQRSGWDDFKGTQFEGYNLIGNSYKMIYSAYNEADSDKSHPMRYGLGQKLAKSGVIKAEITIYDSEKEEAKTVEHCIEYTETDYDSFSNGTIKIEKFGEGNTSEDGLRLFVKYNYVGFTIVTAQDGIEGYEFFVAMLDTDEKVKKYGCNEDNVVITAQYDISEENQKKVFDMKKSVWFGGTANGINDGSRLFLCGNTNENEKSLVIWSGLDNPLYFNENNYAYVGDKSQAVNAFGQQGEHLIIFKDDSTYYSYYVVNNNITAEHLINQSVVDYEANSVYFPMIQLNGSIGCDCPNTIQLCRNRLVWTNSDGNVYTLYSNNQYSERTIYKVSDMISLALCKENDLKNAVSCDFEGHYLLGIGNKIYVMDYNSYGYQYAASFSKNEDSNLQTPWYVWELDCGDNSKIYEIDNKFMVVTNFKSGDDATIAFSMLSIDKREKGDVLAYYDENNAEIDFEIKKIFSMLQTKLFDFSSSGYLKNVDRVTVGFGNNGGEAINVSFIANTGNKSEAVTLDSAAMNERDAAFVTVKNFYPTLRAVRTFGVKIECESPLVVDGLSIRYRLLGGIK